MEGLKSWGMGGIDAKTAADYRTQNELLKYELQRIVKKELRKIMKDEDQDFGVPQQRNHSPRHFMSPIPPPPTPGVQKRAPRLPMQIHMGGTSPTPPSVHQPSMFATQNMWPGRAVSTTNSDDSDDTYGKAALSPDTASPSPPYYVPQSYAAARFDTAPVAPNEQNAAELASEAWLPACANNTDDSMLKKTHSPVLNGIVATRWHCTRCRSTHWERHNFCPKCGQQKQARGQVSRSPHAARETRLSRCEAL